MSYFCKLSPGGGGGGGEGGGTLIFSYIRRRGYFFLGGGFKILKFSFFRIFRKINIFLGGHHKIRLYLGVISMHFLVFF